MNIILAIIIFSFIIIFHELGHFIMAKKNGIRVLEFCLGLGPTIFKVQKGETVYALNLLPFGGACMMEGEDSESDDERAFNKKTVWQRIQVVAAGPVFNFILAYLLAVLFIGIAGYDAPVIASVEEGYPAQEAGIEPGDRITKLNGYPVHFYSEIRLYNFFHPGEKVEVAYERGGEEHTVTLTPKYSEEAGSYLMGMNGSGEREKSGFFGTLAYGAYEVKFQVVSTFESLRMLVTGQLSLNDLSGPVGVVKTIGDAYEQSVQDGIYYVVVNMLSMTILLSANLGVMNLLPIPALDGGRLLFLIVEGIRRKKIDEELEGKIHLVGFALLMVLMVVVLFNDVRKIVFPMLSLVSVGPFW